MLFLLNAMMTEAVPEPKKIDFLCDVCTIIVDGAEDAITEPTNVEKVKEFLDNVCEILPFDIFSWCEQIIDQYYDELLDFITQGYPPEKVCTLIGLCEQA